MIWGGDAYPLLDEPLLQKSYFNQQKLIYSFFQKSKLKNAIYSSFFLFEIWKLKRRNEQQFIIDTIKKFTHFSSVLINEEILFRKYLPLQSAKYMPFNYANTHQLLGDFVDKKIKGNKILIGNSRDPSNSHLEIFNKLKDDQRFSKSFILTPLSYGYAKYLDFIEEKGNEIFEERYIPLRKFMHLEEYIKVISECSICIMNHNRK